MTDVLAKRPEPLLWLNDIRGQYIPRDFAGSFSDRAKALTGVSDDDWAILEAGPEHDLYWDVWDDVLRDATITDEKGQTYTLHQDGDLWLIPTGMAWSDGDDWFTWEEDYSK